MAVVLANKIAIVRATTNSPECSYTVLLPYHTKHKANYQGAFLDNGWERAHKTPSDACVNGSVSTKIIPTPTIFVVSAPLRHGLEKLSSKIRPSGVGGGLSPLSPLFPSHVVFLHSTRIALMVRGMSGMCSAVVEHS